MARARSTLLLLALAALLLGSNACPFAGVMSDDYDVAAVDGAGRKLLQANNCDIKKLVDAGPYNPTGPKTPTASLPHLVKVRAIAFLVLRDGGKIGNTKVSGIQAAGGGINKNVAFGALLRMPFHDCGTFNTKTKTGGCNGSMQREIGKAPNVGKNLEAAMALLLQYQTIINARIAADASIPAGTKLSMADLMVLAGAVVVQVAGGPSQAQLYDRLEIGRVDLAAPAKDDAKRLPAKTLNYAGVMCWYLSAGYTVKETAAALGSHDLGFHKTTVGMSNSPFQWNGAYFKAVLAGGGIFPADKAMNDPKGLTRVHLEKFAGDKAAFSEGFTGFYLRMANMCNNWSH